MERGKRIGNMNGPDSLEKRIEQTETLISILSKVVFLKLKSDLEEWPRTYEFTYLEKNYKAMFPFSVPLL